MFELSDKTNLLEQRAYKYSLQDVPEANLQRDLYSYDEVPRIAFLVRTDNDEFSAHEMLASLYPDKNKDFVIRYKSSKTH